MKLIFYSHSTYSIFINNINILIDPYFIDNPYFNNVDFNIKYFVDNICVDFIFVTHAHYDHVADVFYIAKRTGAVLVSNYEISNYFSNKGIKTISLNFGSFINMDFCNIKYVWASHSSSFKDGTYGGNPGGFIIQDHINKKTIYLSGDTSLTNEMSLISNLNLDLAVLPIGGVFTMDVDDAIKASKLIKCNKILGVHYNTFPSIMINKNTAKNKFLNNGKELILLNFGESLFI